MTGPVVSEGAAEVLAENVVSAVLDGKGRLSESGLVTTGFYRRSKSRGQPIPEEEWDGCWDRSIVAALLAHGDEHGVTIRPDGSLHPAAASPPPSQEVPEGGSLIASECSHPTVDRCDDGWRCRDCGTPLAPALDRLSSPLPPEEGPE